MSLLRKLAKKNQEDPDNHNKIDQQILSGMAKTRIPSFKQLKYLKKYLNTKELIILGIAIAILIISLILVLSSLYKNNLQTVPEQGGSFVEGTIGAPKYLNPIYCNINVVDRDISKLIFSALFKRDNNGYLAKDLVKDYLISPDQKIYTITIRDDAEWHNGDKLTADDVVFTFTTLKNPQYKSPLRYTFNGVEIERVDDYTVRFILKESYAPFMEMLTFGIMPSRPWSGVTPSNIGLAELNIKPIGSGPYEFSSLTKDKNGNVKEYTLKANSNYYDQEPYIEEITFKFFVNPVEAVTALNNGSIDALSYLPFENEVDLVAKNSFHLHRISIPQTTGLFFNLKDSLMKDKEIRKALALSINKEELVNNIFGNGAEIINGPLLPNNFAYTDEITKYNYNADEALRILNEAGWKIPTVEPVESTEEVTADTPATETEAEGTTEEETKTIAEKKEETTAEPVTTEQWLMKNNQELLINLTVLNVPADIQVAENIAEQWKKIGIKTELKVIDPRNVQLEILDSKNFSVVLYSMLTGVDPDPYPLWHSTQVGNLTSYNNNSVDKLLEAARIDNNFEKRKANYTEFQKKLTADLPAIFLYSPKYTYVQIKKIKGFETNTIVNQEDRFANINTWYLKEEKKLRLSNSN
ncbi:MAG: ABC transporter substrate-binding protein [bacterium]